MKINTRVIWSLLAIGGLFIAQALGYTASADELSAGSLMLIGLGEIELPEIKTLIEQQNQAFEEFKSANDERLKAIESKGYAPADVEEKVKKINDDLTRLSNEMAEVMKKQNRPGGGDGQQNEDQAEHKQLFGQFLRKGVDSGLREIERKAMSMRSDPDGGYLITPEMDTMIDRVVSVISAMRSLATVRTIGAASYKKNVKTSGMVGRWIGEGEAGGETTNPKYAQLEIVADECEAEPWVYNSTLEDAEIDLENDLSDEAGIAFGELEGAAFITGDGVKKPRGILSYTIVTNANYAWGKVGYIASGKSADFADTNPGDKIIGLQHALRQQYRPGASFLMNDATLGAVRTLKDGSGNYYLWQPDASAGFGGVILGSPVAIDNNMPDMAANSYSIAYGNFMRGYTIVDRRGTVLIRDNITAKGTTKFNFRRRVGAGVVNFEAIKLMKFATS